MDWAIEHGITTATFHIQTPYPGTRLFARTDAAGRILTRDWDLYDTRHVVYRPERLTPEQLKRGYDWAYREFYRWPSIARGALSHGSIKHQAKTSSMRQAGRSSSRSGTSSFARGSCRS